MSTVKLGKKHATKVTQGESNVTSVKYHATDVVTFDKDTITLNSGGWRTVTTMRRMNHASGTFGLGFGVHQKDFAWFVTYGGTVIPFQDKMTLSRG